MSAGKVLVIGAVGVGLVALFMHAAKANAAPAAKQWPAGWVPPPDADTQTIPAGAGNPTGMTLTGTRWAQTADASGRQPGRWILLQNAANPLNDWVVFFSQENGALGIVASSGSPRAGLMAQAVAAGAIE